MKRLAGMLVGGLLALATTAAAYDGPGPVLTYDKTLQGTNDCIASPGSCVGGATQQIRVQMSVQPQVLNGIAAYFSMSAQVPVISGTTTVNLEIRRVFANPQGYITIGSCTVTPLPANVGSTVSYSCGFEDLEQFPLIGSGLGVGDTAQFYPYVARNGASAVVHNGLNVPVSVPVVGDDTFEDNDSRLTASNIVLPGSNTITLTTLRFSASDLADFYQFTAPAGSGSVQARIDFWDAQCDLDLFFYEPNVDTFSAAGNSSDQDFESISTVIAAGNTYALEVSGAEGSCPAFYTLTITATAPDVLTVPQPTGTPNPVAPGGSVALDVNATDSLGHTLSYAWSQACSSTLTSQNGGQLGVFSNRFVKSPIWTAPPNPTGSNQICNVSVTVDDGFANSGPNAKTSVVYPVTIGPGGDAITITSPPTGTPNPVTPPTPVTVSVAANDLFGHALTYQWSATCPTLPTNGTFANAALATTTWTPPTNSLAATQSCTLSVTISDAPAGSLSVNAGFSQNVAPSVHTLTIQSGPSGSPNPVPSSGVVSLSVTPIDTSGHALNYAWSANCPGLGTGTFSNNTAAAPTWTAPVNSGTTTVGCTISVQVNDGAFGLTVNGNYTQNVQSVHAINFTAGPSATPGVVSTGGSTAVSATAADTLGHTLTYAWTATCTGGIGGGSFVNPAQPSTTYTAPANATGTPQTCTLQVVANDGQGLTRSATVPVTVNAATHTLTFTVPAGGNPNPVNPSSPVSLTATAVDSLAHAVTYAWTASCAAGGNGTFSATNVQSPTWTAPANNTGSSVNCTIQVTASDGQGLTQNSSFTQVINAPNHTITVTTQAAGTPNPVAPNQNVSLNVAAVDSLSHTLSYAWSATCTGGIGGGSFVNPNVQQPTWTSPANNTATIQTCTLSVLISDGQGLTATSSFTETITTPVHTLSIVTGSLKGTPNPSANGELVAMSVNALDTFGHPLQYLWQATCADVPTNGTFSPSATAAAPTWTPPANNTGGNVSCLIRVTVIDGQGLSATGNFIQTVTNALPHNVTITAGPTGTPNPVASAGTVSMSATGTDTLGHALTYAWTSVCTNLSSGTFSNAAVQNPTWTAPTNLTGSTQPCTITVTANDGLGKTGSATYTQNVQSVPHSLTITQQPNGTPNPIGSQGVATLSVAATDSLSHALTYQWTASCTVVGNGTFSNAAAQNPTWTAPTNQTGSNQSCTIAVTVSDGANGLLQSANYVHTVTPVTHTLTITQQPTGSPNPVNSSSAVTLSVAATDSLGHTLAYAWTAVCPGLGNGSFNSQSLQNPTWTAPVNATAAPVNCTMTVVVDDGGGGLSQTATYTQVVNPHTLTITTQPSGTPNPVASSGTVNMSVGAVDTLNHTLNFQWTAVCSGIGNGTFSSATAQTPVWTAAANLTGSAKTCTITVVVDDGAGGLSQTASFTQTVNSVPHSLSITAGPIGTPNPVNVGGTVALSATATDSLNHAVTYAWTSVCGSGSGSFSNAAAQNPTWTPPVITPGSSTTCTMSVTASDGQGLTDTKTYTQTVNAATSHTLTIAQQPKGTPNPSGNGQGVVLTVGVVDSFGHALTYLWQANCPGAATNGTFSPNQNNASPTWTPPTNNTGSDLTCLMSVLVIDNQGLSANASFIQRVTVASPSHTVTFTTQPSGTPNPVASGGTATLSTAAVDSLGHALTYAWTAACGGGLGAGAFSNAAAQNPTWTAPANNTGTPQACTIGVTANDGQGQTATASYTQTVAASAAHTLTITQGPAGTPNPVAAAGSVALSVTAVDSLAHPLTYAWTASCGGSGGNGAFNNATLQNPTWVAPTNSSGNTVSCTIQVTVNDNQGLQGAVAQNSYVQQVLSSGQPHTLTITSAPTGAPNPVASGAGVAMTATGTDSLGHTVFYSWQATCPGLLGSNGVFSPSAGVQVPSWQAPTNSTGTSQTCVITVTVNDSFGLSQSASYNQAISPSNVTHSLNITQAPSGSPNPSAPGAQVALSVTAVDTLAHTLTYLWQATCAEVSGTGTFVPNANSPSPIWTPPASPSGVDLNCLIRVTVVDGLDKSATASFVQKVQQSITPPHTVTFTTPPAGTPNPVASGGTAALTTTALDSLSHALTYTWTASCPGIGNGTFAPSNVAQSPSWTAPANLSGSEVTCVMTVVANDGQGQTAQAQYTQKVSTVPHTLTITAGPVGTPNPVAPGATANLSVSATDSLSHTITYVWQSTCTGVVGGGTFSPGNTAQNPTWAPPVHPSGQAFSCVISVTAGDGQGLTAVQSYTQNVSAGAPPAHTVTITVPPAGTPNPVAPGANVALSVTAVDSQAHTLTYQWSATCLGLSSNGSFTGGNTSTPTWTAPNNATGSAQPCTILVVADDLLGQTASASYVQTVSAAPGGHTINITAAAAGTPNPVDSAGVAQLSVTAVDSQGHSLAYLWQAACASIQDNGSFSNATVATPQWTAPINPFPTPLTCVITVQIVDGFGLSVTSQYTQTVSISSAHTLVITQQPSGAPDPCNDSLPPGSPAVTPCPTTDSDSAVNLTVTAVDSLGHDLEYLWTATCPGLPNGGSFQPSATVKDPTWVVPTNYTNAVKNCAIQVAVTDGSFGKSATGTYPQGINVNPAPVPITVIAQNYVGGALDPDTADPNTPLSLPNYAVVLYRCAAPSGPCTVSDATEVHAIDAFSLSGSPSLDILVRAREWERSVTFAQGETAVLRIYRNASSNFSPFWASSSPNGPAWRTNTGGRQLVAEQSIVIQPNAIYTISALVDLDNDLMDDTWESANGLNPASSADATGDLDSDGLTNLAEFQNGTDPNDSDTDNDSVSDKAEVDNFDKPADASDWTPPALRATVGNGTIYVSWNGVLNTDVSGAKLQVEQVSPAGATVLVDLDRKASRFLLTQLPTTPTPTAIANGNTYRLRFVLTRTGTGSVAPVTRTGLLSESVTVRPGTISFSPSNPTVFLHGYGGQADLTGTFADTLDFARFTLGWEFGGRFCLSPSGTVTVGVDNTVTSASTRTLSDPVFGSYGNTNCGTLAGTPTLGGAAPDFFTVDFGNNLANQTSGTDGLTRQANEVDAVLDTLFGAVASPKVALVGQGTGGLAARQYLANSQDNTRVARLVTIGTPNAGQDTSYWCASTATSDALALGGVYGRLVTGLSLGGACGVTPVDGLRDAAVSCVNSLPQTSTFLTALAGLSLPSGVGYVSSVGFWEAPTWNAGSLPSGGQRGIDCLSRTWNGLVPTSTAELTDVLQPVGVIESERFAEGEGNDLSTVYCGLNEKCLTIRLTSSQAEMSVTFGGLVVSRTRAEIPGASFMTRFENGQEVAWITLPFAAAAQGYTVQVSPTVVAPSTSYLLESIVGGGTPVVIGSSTHPVPNPGPDSYLVTVP